MVIACFIQDLSIPRVRLRPLGRGAFTEWEGVYSSPEAAIASRGKGGGRCRGQVIYFCVDRE